MRGAVGFRGGGSGRSLPGSLDAEKPGDPDWWRRERSRGECEPTSRKPAGGMERGRSSGRGKTVGRWPGGSAVKTGSRRSPGLATGLPLESNSKMLGANFYNHLCENQTPNLEGGSPSLHVTERLPHTLLTSPLPALTCGPARSPP